MVQPGAEVHIFFRENNSEPFIYIGLGYPAQVDDTVPVGVRWSFTPQDNASDIPDATPYQDELRIEGATSETIAKRYERSPSARAQCIKHYGHQCQVCGIDFGKAYGPWGNGFIHVHHHTPISTINGPYVVDPIRDLIPVCPNCHAMLHRKKEVITVDELKGLIKRDRET
ncbi:HNH endonuclease [Luteibacter sp.]|uniref:HNH endonuclease n=1 Tax=Luteibacter sp. TaxID=1886636 RepID=UPI0025C4A64A|nr:HNH endonuclease [Luteibacter sp.]